jgi:Alkylmercury lyase
MMIIDAGGHAMDQEPTYRQRLPEQFRSCQVIVCDERLDLHHQDDNHQNNRLRGSGGVGPPDYPAGSRGLTKRKLMNVKDLDQAVRYKVYQTAMDRGRPPHIAELVGSLAVGEEGVRASLDRLASAHVLVLQAGSGEILMADPFSAIPTPFAVEVNGRQYFGICIWDALGIPAMLKLDGTHDASCGCCGLSMVLEVRGGALQPSEGVVHFAVPARKWWEDIIFT